MRKILWLCGHLSASSQLFVRLEAELLICWSCTHCTQFDSICLRWCKSLLALFVETIPKSAFNYYWWHSLTSKSVARNGFAVFFIFFFVVVWFLVFSSYSCQSSSFISLSIKSGETRKRYASKNPNKRVSQIIFFGAKLLADDETFMTNTAVSRHFNGNDTHTKSRLLLSLRCSLDSKWHARFVKICSFCCDSDVKCLFCLTFFKQTFLVEELQKMHATKHPSRRIQCKFKYFGSVWQMYVRILETVQMMFYQSNCHFLHSSFIFPSCASSRWKLRFWFSSATICNDSQWFFCEENGQQLLNVEQKMRKLRASHSNVLISNLIKSFFDWMKLFYSLRKQKTKNKKSSKKSNESSAENLIFPKLKIVSPAKSLEQI